MSLLLFPLSQSRHGGSFTSGCHLEMFPLVAECFLFIFWTLVCYSAVWKEFLRSFWISQCCSQSKKSVVLLFNPGQGSKWSSASCQGSPLGWPLLNLSSTHCHWWLWASPALCCSLLSLKGQWKGLFFFLNSRGECGHLIQDHHTILYFSHEVAPSVCYGKNVENTDSSDGRQSS